MGLPERNEVRILDTSDKDKAFLNRHLLWAMFLL